VTPTEQYLHAIADHFDSALGKFILKHGRAFEPDPLTFKGWTGEPKNCFGNAVTLLCGSAQCDRTPHRDQLRSARQRRGVRRCPHRKQEAMGNPGSGYVQPRRSAAAFRGQTSRP
jgi:hypothetical protein